MKDNRDPSELGSALLSAYGVWKPTSKRFSWVADRAIVRVRDYRDETTIEKYGDPRLLPSALPN